MKAITIADHIQSAEIFWWAGGNIFIHGLLLNFEAKNAQEDDQSGRNLIAPTRRTFGSDAATRRAIHRQSIIVRHRTVGRTRYRCHQVWECVVKETVVNQSTIGEGQPAGRRLTGHSESEGASMNQCTHGNLQGYVDDVVARSASIWITG